MRVGVLAALIMLLAVPATARAADNAPGAPGAVANWAPGNKDGFGTSTTLASKVWYTLNGGELTEVYYPDLGTPTVRDLQFVVTDGKTFTERETDGSEHTTELTDSRSLSYEQINTDSQGRFRITKTYTTDPSRPVLLDAGALRVADQGATAPVRALRPQPVGQRRRRLGFDRRQIARRLGREVGAARSSPRRRSPRPRAATWARATAGPTCASHHRWTGTTPRRPDGNVVQTGCDAARPASAGSQNATMALGFGTDLVGGADERGRVAARRGFGSRRARVPVRVARVPRRASAPARASRAIRSSTTSR